MKKRILTYFCAFLTFMTVCTVISKGIYKAGLARVTLCQIERRSITQEVSAPGYVLHGREFGVYAMENLRVSVISVQPGDRVTAGDVLFAVDLHDLETQILAAEEELNYLKAQLSDIAEERKAQARERERGENALLDEYDRLVREHDLRIADCQLAAEEARLRMQAAEEQAAAGQKAEVGTGSVSGSDLLPVQEETSNPDQLHLASGLAKIEYEKALHAVEEAKLRKEEALKDWERRLKETGDAGGSATAQTVRLQGEIRLVQARVAKMRELELRQGNICADADGIIAGCLVRTGERTPDGACMLYTVPEGGGEVQVTLEEREAALLSLGDSVALQYKTIAGEKRRCGGIITYMEQSDGQKILRIKPEEEILIPGQTVQVSASVKSDSYEQVLPVGAIHAEELSGYYVYVVETGEGILGTEDLVRKIPVTVKEQNLRYAAVESTALCAESRVIKDSSKELKEKDVVRILTD